MKIQRRFVADSIQRLCPWSLTRHTVRCIVKPYSSHRAPPSQRPPPWSLVGDFSSADGHGLPQLLSCAARTAAALRRRQRANRHRLRL